MIHGRVLRAPYAATGEPMRLTFLLLLTLCFVACEGKRAEGGWWRYGLSGSSPFWHELHLYDDDSSPNQTILVAITIFADENRAVHHVLEQDGRGSTQRGEARKAFRRTPEQVVAAQDLLANIRPGGDYPPPERLVIVRWHDGRTWATARFDRTALPSAVQDLAALIAGRPIGDIEP